MVTGDIKPKVSVIMACYNAEPYLKKSIESVINQTFRDLELIIVDDASSDNSLLIASREAESDNRIKVFALQKNGGAGNARNYAISKANGEWLAILDADDVFLPNKLEKQIRIADRAGSDLVLIGTDSYEIDKHGIRFSMQRYPAESKILINNLVKQKRFPPHSSLMYKASIVNKLGGYDNRLCPSEDYNLWLHLSQYGSFTSVQEPLIEYRHHITNISKANSGFEQLKYGFAAAICHFLRIKGYNNPLDPSNSTHWLRFENWLSWRLKDENILAYRHRKERYRMDYFKRSDKFLGVLQLFGVIIFDPVFLSKFIYEKIKGTSLPLRLAEEWIERDRERLKVVSTDSTDDAFTGQINHRVGKISPVKVSVIMACKNSARFIREAIGSVINQTYEDIELIIIDNASSDNSVNIANQAAKEDPRIKVISLTENVGAGTARNIGISQAAGDWIAILDADDNFLPDKIERQLDVINKTGSDLVLIGTDSYEIDAYGNRFSLQRYPKKSEDLIFNLKRRKRFPPHSSLMYKADILRTINCYNKRYTLAQDYDLWLRISSYGRFSSVPYPLVEYRHHESNLSNKNSGFDQVKFSFAASICYYIRSKGYSDPSLILTQDEWEKFLRWISLKLEEKHIQDFIRKRSRWRNEFMLSDNNLMKTLKLLSIAFYDPDFSLKIIKERFIGTRLPELLAEEWLIVNELKHDFKDGRYSF